MAWWLTLAFVLAAYGLPQFREGAKPMAQKLYKFDPTLASPCKNLTACGQPLFLTPLIKAGKIQEARTQAQITDPVFLGLTSYAGFITTNATTGNNLYFWYWPSQTQNTSAPLLIWLQGGPGAPSLFGMFSENGPVEVQSNLSLKKRQFNWNTDYQMIYIDNPVGAGFSFTEQDAGYARNSIHDVAVNLYSLLEQFYTMFPELQSVPLYTTGESYGGHYVPSLTYMIFNQNKMADSAPGVFLPKRMVMPLKGMAIGDAWIDPPTHVLEYPNLLYYYDIANEPERQEAEIQMLTVADQIRNQQYLDAFKTWDKFLNGDIFPYPTFYFNISGSHDYDAYVPPPNPVAGPWMQFVTQDHIRRLAHIGNATFQDGRACEMHLLEDFMHTLGPQVGELMDNIPVMLYNGQIDVIVATPLTEAFLRSVAWSGKQQWLSTPKQIWRLSPSAAPAGYVRQLYNFTQVVVRDAGHLVPQNQPQNALDMITRWIKGKPFS